jgi:hypothetical protein
MKQKIGSFFIADVVGQVLDSVAAVFQVTVAFSAFQVGNRGFVGNHTFQARVENARQFRIGTHVLPRDNQQRGKVRFVPAEFVKIRQSG